ncbi:hypothetical protein BJP25_09545 [Actinokineospora bangkokensis]|uniref:Uncharacterized protein n=1 Tax=Actinokineospora bangkokensis TaxID=1193682 RepID=A0A1Q9LS38_9PSEU|nr:hypothetical protein BJP25_09545 [Actinokineospora bangkokensis]
MPAVAFAAIPAASSARSTASTMLARAASIAARTPRTAASSSPTPAIAHPRSRRLFRIVGWSPDRWVHLRQRVHFAILLPSFSRSVSS